MSFSTYAGLKEEIAEWLDRTDLTAKIPGFIELAESSLSRALRTREQWTEQTLTVNSEYEDLPADWAETSTLTLQTTPVTPLSYVTPEAFRLEKRERSATGRPKVYTLAGKRLRFAPVPDIAYTALHEYWAKLTPLSSTNQTNWLLDDHPDVYLYSSLAQAYVWLRDPEGRAEADGMAAKTIADLVQAYKRSEFPTTPRVKLHIA